MKAFVLNGDEASQKLILQANIPFIELMKKAHFAYRVNPSDNPYSPEGDDDSNYQRYIDTARVKAMVKYLKGAITQNMNGSKVAVIYPTAMLLAFNSVDDEITLEIGKEYTIDLPEDDLYIVDGQHRLFSMITLYNEVAESFLDEEKSIKDYLDHYTFNCTLMMNFDMWEQGQVFADVNFKQKPVNKSLYYDIYGIQYPQDSVDRSKNYIYIAHKLVQFMNDKKESPFYHCIKMLGTGKGYFSQACLAESVMKHMQTPRGIWYIDSSDLESKPDYSYMAVELISYYTCINRLFQNYWPKDFKNVSILCKTTGIYAMTRLMGYIHNRLNDRREFNFETLKNIKVYVNKQYISAITPYLSKLLPYSDKLFGKDGDFTGTGGKGLAAKLYKRMYEIIDSGK